MGRSIPSFALVLAILLGLGSRVEGVVAHAHDGGEAEHHHADLAYVGHVLHAHAHDHPHDAPPAEAPTVPADDDDPGHSHCAATDGPLLRRCGAAADAARLLDAVACGPVAPAACPVASAPPRGPDAPGPSPTSVPWPPGTTLERRLEGLGLLY